MSTPPLPARLGRVGIVLRAGLRDAAETLSALAAWLGARGLQAACDPETAALAPRTANLAAVPATELPRTVELVVVLGGDGTLLGAARQIAGARATVPLLGVNVGSLGFLTEITLDELYASLDAALAGDARIDERMMLHGRLVQGARVHDGLVALNDIVIGRGAGSRIIDLSVTVDDQFVARFKADGLIVASPTGSTAYNLAAGGPIVHPAMQAMVLTPIAPHTLTNRPIVIPASAEIRIQSLETDADSRVVVTVDGQLAYPLSDDDVVIVSQSTLPLRVVRPETRSYFEVLRQKLKWAER
jgi:NAD+ kinase